MTSVLWPFNQISHVVTSHHEDGIMHDSESLLDCDFHVARWVGLEELWWQYISVHTHNDLKYPQRSTPRSVWTKFVYVRPTSWMTLKKNAKDESFHTEQKKLIEERFYWKSTRTDEDRISICISVRHLPLLTPVFCFSVWLKRTHLINFDKGSWARAHELWLLRFQQCFGWVVLQTWHWRV